jgi:hypothetical protein
MAPGSRQRVYHRLIQGGLTYIALLVLSSLSPVKTGFPRITRKSLKFILKTAVAQFARAHAAMD